MSDNDDSFNRQPNSYTLFGNDLKENSEVRTKKVFSTNSVEETKGSSGTNGVTYAENFMKQAQCQ